MFEFKTAPPSKALAYGTNMSCLDDRLYVCRLNKHFVINNDKNTVVLEEGDIIVCHNAYDKSYGSDKKYGIAVSTKNAVMNMTSKDIMDYEMPSRIGHIPMMSTEDFKQVFEVLDDETESLTDCIRFAQAQNNNEKLTAANEKCDNIRHDYNQKEDRRNNIFNIGLIIICVLGIISLIALAIKYNLFQDESGFAEAQILGLLGVILGIVLLLCMSLFLIFGIVEDETIITPFNIKNRPLYDTAVREKDTILINIHYEIDEYRRKRGWLS